MNIYVGNFSYEVTGDDLKDVFGAYGHVKTAKVIRDKFTGESKGFGFVEMPNTPEANAALLGITEIKGKSVAINEARPQTTNTNYRSIPKRDTRRTDNFRTKKRY